MQQLQKMTHWCSSQSSTKSNYRRRFDPEVPDSENRSIIVLARQHFAGPFEAIDDAQYRGHLRAGFFDLVDRLDHGTAGGEDVVEDGDAHAGLEDAFDAFL